MDLITSIALFAGTFAAVVLTVRHRSPSLGLPVAYLFQLLLIHVPGAVIHALPWANLTWHESSVIGASCAAVGAACFVAGTWLARMGGVCRMTVIHFVEQKFLWFSLFLGWTLMFLVRSVLKKVPSITAAVEIGSMVWMIAVMVALPLAFRSRSLTQIALWFGALSLYPLLCLVDNGFLVWGVNAAIVCLSFMAVLTKQMWRIWAGLAALIVLGMGLFATYVGMRDEIRKVVWGGEKLERRWSESWRLVTEFRLMDLHNPEDLYAVNWRLNQNYLVGMAMKRLQKGEVDYYKGKTVVQGFQAMIPRILWPGKPVFAGSGNIVMEMTGFYVGKGTSYGVGNVLEFYINFGMPSLVVGFMLLGWILGKLDYLGAMALSDGDYPRVIVCILPAMALIQPERAIVEMASGAAAGLVAALFWKWLWGMMRTTKKQMLR